MSFGPLGGSMGPVTMALLIVNVALFLVGLIGLVPGAFVLQPGDVVRGQLWQLVTHGFIHGSLGHLLANGLALFFFGSMAEAALGRRAYLAMIFAAIVAAGLAHTIIYLGSAPSLGLIGFSSAVFAILVGAFFVAPNATVLLYFVIPVKIKVLVVGLIVLELFLLFRDSGGNVSHLGHLAGAFVGLAFFKVPAVRRLVGGRDDDDRRGGGSGGGQRLSMGHPGRNPNASDKYDDPHWRLDQ